MTNAPVLTFSFGILTVVMKPTRDNNWVGYPVIDGQEQKKFRIELTKCKDGANIAAICKRGRSSSERSFDRATDRDVMESALKALGQMVSGEEVTVPPVSRMNPLRPDPKTFLIECEHCAVVPGPYGTMQLLIFNPKGDTIKRALAWKREGDRRYIEIEDRSGTHVRKIAVLVIHYLYSYGTLWIGTDK